jgi:hypothetical protein
LYPKSNFSSFPIPSPIAKTNSHIGDETFSSRFPIGPLFSIWTKNPSPSPL